MNRYSAGNSALDVGTYVVPLVPYSLLSAIYRDAVYTATPVDMLLLWGTGLLVSFLLIAIHESGHLIAARAVGIETDSVTIGHWRKLVSFSLGKLKVIIRAAPSSGYVMAKPVAKQHAAWRTAIFVGAGVIAEGLCVLLVALKPGPADILGFGDQWFAYCRICVLLIGGIHVLMTLIPHEGSVGGQKLANDALLLLTLWRQRACLPAQQQLVAELAEVDGLWKARDFQAAIGKTQALVERQPENVSLAQLLGSLHQGAGDTAAAETTWRELLKRQDLPPIKRAEILDLLCCLLVYDRRIDLLSEADAWSREALRLSPQAITLKGTRGNILVELGRIDEGGAMLHEVMKRSECQIDHAISAAYLAKVCVLKGKTEDSKRWLSKANAIDPAHVVVKRITSELAA